MRRPLSFWLRGLVHVAVLVAVGALAWKALTPAAVAITLDDQVFRLSGPYHHENLAVYLIHANEQDERPYITLQEGLEKGLVKVTEKYRSEASELLIDNQSDLHLFLQEGDRLQGGKQDRTIYASHVVPPKSGFQALPAFCIEPSRWSGAEEFKHVANTALAPQEVRLAAKYQNDQNAVWANVAKERQAISANIRSLNYQTTSLNEALESKPIKELCDGFALALQDVVKQHPDAVGVAIVINGQVEEVNIYPNHGLLSKQYPRLIQSYALQAVAHQGEKVTELSTVEVARTMHLGQQPDSARQVLADRRTELVGQQVRYANDAQQAEQLGQQQEGVITGNPIAQQSAGRQTRMRFRSASNGDVGLAAPAILNDPASAETGGSGQVLRQVSRPINAHNRMELFENGRMVGGKTDYDGKTVHRQLIRK